MSEPQAEKKAEKSDGAEIAGCVGASCGCSTLSFCLVLIVLIVFTHCNGWRLPGCP